MFKDLSESDRNEADNLNSVEDVQASLEARKASDNLRYKKYYDLDVFNPDNYDLVINSTNMPADEVVQVALDYIKENA